MVTLASVWSDLGSLRRPFGSIGVTLASFWGAKGAQTTNSRFRARAGRVQGQCRESARRVQGGCEYRSKANLTGAKAP